MGWVRSRISTFATVKWVLPALLLPSVRRSKRQLPALNLSFPPSQVFNVHSTVTLVRAADLDGTWRSFLLAADSALTAAVNFFIKLRLVCQSQLGQFFSRAWILSQCVQSSSAQASSRSVVATNLYTTEICAIFSKVSNYLSVRCVAPSRPT